MSPLRVTLLVLLCLVGGCSPTPSKDPWDSYKMTSYPHDGRKVEFGKGLKGRMVEGRRVYTVQVDCIISTEGKVTHAHVHRADAPERLQWGVVRGVKQMRYEPRKKPAMLRQTFLFRSLDVKPG
jgi:hypothetical protein